jgi:hypothetical protein
MSNKDLFKQAIAEAKSVREAAIVNAKEALEESLTPHLKDMLAAKLQEMEDKSVEEEVVNEIEEELEEGDYSKEESVEETVEEELTEVEPVGEAEEEEVADEEEAEDDSEESEDDAEAVEGDEDLGDLSVDQFKDLIRDIISQEMGHGEEEIGADLDAGDIEGLGDEPEAIEEPAADDEEIDLDELLRELESISEEEVEEGKKEEVDGEVVEEDTANQVEAQSDTKDHNVNDTLKEALETVESLKQELSEVNLLNSKLLYVNKIFKANTLSESQKVNIIAAFDKAETVKEVKLVFETVSENVVTTKKENVSESKFKGMASKATGTTANKPAENIVLSEAVLRMQKLAGIIK